jgi:hypothetical protein
MMTYVWAHIETICAHTIITCSYFLKITQTFGGHLIVKVVLLAYTLFFIDFGMLILDF